MGLSKATLITELRKQLGVDTDDMPDVDAELLLNRAYWATLNKFDFKEKEQTTFVITGDGIRDYTMSPSNIEAVTNVYMPGDADSAPVKLQQRTEEWYAEIYNQDDNFRGSPTDYVRFGNFLRIYPTPDASYNIYVDHLAVLSDLPTLGPAIPQEWHEIVLMGGVWRGHMSLREYQQAYAVKNMMKDEIAETVPVKSKEESDNRYAAISMPIPRNKF